MINIFIQCRIHSVRLPGKAFIKFYDKTIIERLIHIAKKTKFKKRIFLLSGNEKKNFKLKKIAKKLKIDIFFGNENNVLDRYCKAIQYFNIDHNDYIMRLTADNYLIQPKILNELTRHVNKYEYIYVSPLSNFSGELFKVKSLIEKIANKRLSSKTKEHTTWNFRLLKNIKRKTLSKNLFGINHNCKITLDTPADLLFLKKIENNKNFKNVDCLNDVKKLTKMID